jgi:hypothetical protein
MSHTGSPVQAAPRSGAVVDGWKPEVRTVKMSEVVGRCFACANPLTRNRWEWDVAGMMRLCRNQRACDWRNEHGIRDTIVWGE